MGHILLNLQKGHSPRVSGQDVKFSVYRTLRFLWRILYLVLLCHRLTRGCQRPKLAALVALLAPNNEGNNVSGNFGLKKPYCPLLIDGRIILHLNSGQSLLFCRRIGYNYIWASCRLALKNKTGEKLWFLQT